MCKHKIARKFKKPDQPASEINPKFIFLRMRLYQLKIMGSFVNGIAQNNRTAIAPPDIVIAMCHAELLLLMLHK